MFLPPCILEAVHQRRKEAAEMTLNYRMELVFAHKGENSAHFCGRLWTA